MNVLNRISLTFIFFIFFIISQSASQIASPGSVVLNPERNYLVDKIFRTPRSGLSKLCDRFPDARGLRKLCDRISNTRNSTNNDSLKYTKLSQLLVKIGKGFYYIEAKNAVNFFEADQICKLHGLVLVSLETEFEAKNLQSHLTKNYPLVTRFWTSGNDLAHEGTYVWMSTGLPFTHASWLPGQPDNFKNDEDCVELRAVDNMPLDWNDNSCLWKSAFVCELVE